MKKISFLILLVFFAFIYVFSAMHSFHQVHKSIYYNNKQISKNYIEWKQVRNNFKDFMNASFLDKMSNDKELGDLEEVGILVTGLASKFIEYAIDTYINSDGLSVLLKNSGKKSDIPEPSFTTLIGGISIMKFDSLNTFYVNIETDENNIPVYFKRIGTKWKVVEISFPEDFFKNL